MKHQSSQQLSLRPIASKCHTLHRSDEDHRHRSMWCQEWPYPHRLLRGYLQFPSCKTSTASIVEMTILAKMWSFPGTVLIIHSGPIKTQLRPNGSKAAIHTMPLSYSSLYMYPRPHIKKLRMAAVHCLYALFFFFFAIFLTSKVLRFA